MKTQIKTAHTQGEWEIAKYPAVDYPYFIKSEYTSSHIALIGNPTEGEQYECEANANAKLIAAAPDMFAALLEAKRCLIERIRIDYTTNNVDCEMAQRMAERDIKEFLLFNAIEKASI